MYFTNIMLDIENISQLVPRIIIIFFGKISHIFGKNSRLFSVFFKSRNQQKKSLESTPDSCRNLFLAVAITG